MATLYQSACKAGLAIDSHESDLYLKDCLEARRLVQNSRSAHSFFTNRIDGKRWIDVPFCYDPWWAARAQGKVPSK